MALDVGVKVRVIAKHWARGSQVGEILELVEADEGTRYLVVFSRKGVGINGGRMLVLGEKDLSEIYETHQG
jgi:hypothetical protein